LIAGVDPGFLISWGADLENREVDTDLRMGCDFGRLECKQTIELF